MTIDVWAQINTPRMLAHPCFESLHRWSRKDGERPVPTVESTVAAMDAGGVDISLIAAWHSKEGSLISNEEVANDIAKAPKRLKGLATVDLNKPAESVRELRDLLDGNTFVGVRVVPWMWGLPPNDRRYYPIYMACIDAGVPFCTQIGHTGPLLTSETGRPMPYLEDVLLDFPELKILGGHVGFPWVNEVISLIHKFPNFHVDTSAYALHRLPPDFVHFLKGPGAKRIMFGTNWPMIAPEKALAGLDGLGLDDAQKQAFLHDNAARLFNL